MGHFEGQTSPEKLAHTAKTVYFQGQTSPEHEFRPHFCQNFTWTSVKSLPIEQLSLTAKPAHFLGQKIPRAVRTLAMEPIGTHGQNGPFAKSNELQSR
ncbi:hypothetical protein KY290_000001 [Solanum tuberosum]|uniref:Uncharacterized protein n=1 Tax=Solanum tuberosum TaxID=4113 RepID=A0ABQ7WK36_SOLTU|nr:hypothetical protein KY290_000001 [Solanum tuberosum]